MKTILFHTIRFFCKDDFIMNNMLIDTILFFNIIIQIAAVYYSQRLSKAIEFKKILNSISAIFGIIALINIVIFVNRILGNAFVSKIKADNIMILAISGLAVAGLAIVHKCILAKEEIIEEKEVEIEGLKDEVELHKLILEATSDGVYDFYPESGKTYFSFRSQSMLGYDDAIPASTYKDWQKLVHPDEQAYIMKELKDYLSGKIPKFDVEYRILTKEGEWFWIHSRGKIVEKDKKGNAIRMIGTYADINDRKDTEEKLHQTLKQIKESEQKLQLKIDSIFSSNDVPNENIKLTDLFDIEFLQKVQDTFAAASNIATLITDVDGQPITQLSNFSKICQMVRQTEKGNFRCIESNKKLGEKAKKLMMPTYEKCGSCGFALASAPIVVGNKHIGNCLIGHSNSMGVQEKDIIRYAHEIEANVENMVEAFRIMPKMPLSQFEKNLELLWMFIEELTAKAYSNLKLSRELEKQKREYFLEKE